MIPVDALTDNPYLNLAASVAADTWQAIGRGSQSALVEWVFSPVIDLLSESLNFSHVTMLEREIPPRGMCDVTFFPDVSDVAMLRPGPVFDLRPPGPDDFRQASLWVEPCWYVSLPPPQIFNQAKALSIVLKRVDRAYVLSRSRIEETQGLWERVLSSQRGLGL